MVRWLLACSVLVMTGCSGGGLRSQHDVSVDGGSQDSTCSIDRASFDDSGRARDSAVSDSGIRDSGVSDSGTRDSGIRDSAVIDSGTRDSGTRDSWARDSGISDSGTRDSATHDLSSYDSSDAPGPTYPPGLSLVAGLPGGQGNVNGVGARARFRDLAGIACDGHGHAFVADYNNCAIRQIDLATGAVTTLAGLAGECGLKDDIGSDARFFGPIGVASDGGNFLYVADASNYSVRRIAVDSGVVTTLAGQPGVFGTTDGVGANATFDALGSISFIDSNTLFVFDGSLLRRIRIDSREVVTALNISYGTGLVYDGARYGYMLDHIDGLVLYWDTQTGQVGTFAAGLSLPTALTINSASTFLYVADNFGIHEITIATGGQSLLAGGHASGESDGVGANAGFAAPTGIALDGAGNLLIAEAVNVVRRLALNTNAVTTIAGAADSAALVDGIGNAARLNGPAGIAVDGAIAYVADAENHVIRRIDPATGATVTVFGSGVYGNRDDLGRDAQFADPLAIVADGLGNLFVADASPTDGTVRQIILSTGQVLTLAGRFDSANHYANGIGSAARFWHPSALALDGAGYLYVADANNEVRRIRLSTAEVTRFAGSGVSGHSDGVGTAASFQEVSAIVNGGPGRLYVADGSFRQITISDAHVTTLLRNDTTSPSAITYYGSDTIYFTSGSTVGSLTLSNLALKTLAGVSGQQGVQAGPLPASLFGPEGIAILPDGILLVTDAEENALLRVVF